MSLIVNGTKSTNKSISNLNVIDFNMIQIKKKVSCRDFNFKDKLDESFKENFNTSSNPYSTNESKDILNTLERKVSLKNKSPELMIRNYQKLHTNVPSRKLFKSLNDFPQKEDSTAKNKIKNNNSINTFKVLNSSPVLIKSDKTKSKDLDQFSPKPFAELPHLDPKQTPEYNKNHEKNDNDLIKELVNIRKTKEIDLTHNLSSRNSNSSNTNFHTNHLQNISFNNKYNINIKKVVNPYSRKNLNSDNNIVGSKISLQSINLQGNNDQIVNNQSKMFKSVTKSKDIALTNSDNYQIKGGSKTKNFNQYHMNKYNSEKTNSKFDLTPENSPGFHNKKIKKNISKNSAYKTQPGINSYGLRKINQDNYILMKNVLDCDQYSIFGVLDGHGENGHHVSNAINSYLSNYFKSYKNYKITCNLPNFRGDTSLFINSNSKKNSSLINRELDINSYNEEIIYDFLVDNDYELIRKAFIQAENEISNMKFNVNFSGSTGVLVFIINDKIICANVGDSRAIIVTDVDDGKSSSKILVNILIERKSSLEGYNFRNLSIDHKPELENEKKRIISMGGKVEMNSHDGVEFGPYRVYLKNERYPGLAMSRSIGDLIASSVGVICNPEIIENHLNEESKYLVIASDGVWEFLDNGDVMNIVNPYYLKNDPDGACDEIIKLSTELWENEDCVVDDITVIVIFLHHS